MKFIIIIFLWVTLVYSGENHFVKSIKRRIISVMQGLQLLPCVELTENREMVVIEIRFCYGKDPKWIHTNVFNE